MATGQIQGQIQAQEEMRRQQQQDYSNALQQFQIGHGLEAEQKASEQDYFNKQLALAPQVEPGTPRADFISQIFKNMNNVNARAPQYGTEAFGHLAQGAPGAAHFPQPAYQPPPVLSTPATLPAQGGGPGPGTTPGPSPTPYAIGGLLDAYQQNPAQVAPPTTTEQAALAAQAQVPGMGMQGPAAGGPSPPGANYSVDAIMSQILGGPAGNPQGAPGVSPPGAPLPSPAGGDPRAQLWAQAGINPEIGQQAISKQQHAHSMAGVIGGSSGSNVAGTAPPHDHHPEITRPSGFGPAFGGQPMGPGAPPAFVPPSASMGTAPQVVAPQPVLRLPGFDQPIPFGAVKPEVVGRYETAFTRTLDTLNRSHLPDYLRSEVARVAAQRPYKVETPEELQQLVAVTEQLGVLAAGRGAGVYSAEQRAAGMVDQQRDRDIKNVLAALGKSPRSSDPAYVGELVRNIGQGRIDDLIPSFATGQFGGVEARKELAKVMSEIADPNFARLQPSVQKLYFQSAIGLGKQFGETLTFPAEFITRLTKKELRQLAQADVRLALQGDALSVSVAREELARDRLNAQIEGLIGRPAVGADGKHVLTPNGQLNARGRLYDKATADYNVLFKDKTFLPARNEYLELKQDAMASGTQDYVAIRNLTKHENKKIRIIAEKDLDKLHAQHDYQDTIEQLITQAQQPAAAAAPAAAASAPARQPVPNRGVPGAFQGPRVPAVVNGERKVIDTTARVAYLMSTGMSKPDAQAYVRKEVQAAKSGR